MRDYFLVMIIDQGSALVLAIGVALGIAIGAVVSGIYYSMWLAKYQGDVLQRGRDEK